MSYEEIDWESFGELETPEAKIKRLEAAEKENSYEVAFKWLQEQPNSEYLVKCITDARTGKSENIEKQDFENAAKFRDIERRILNFVVTAKNEGYKIEDVRF